MGPQTPGAQLWVRRYNGTANSGDAAYALAVSPDGTKVFVTGESQGVGSASDYATVAYDTSTGTQLWASRYNGPGNLGDAATSLGVSPDGTKVFVTGQSDGGTGSGIDYATMAYDTSTGAQLWLSRYGSGASIAIATSLGVSPDGTRVWVTGQGAGGIPHYATIAYDALTGTQLWLSSYDGPGAGADEALSLDASSDGTRVFVTGKSSGGASGNDYATVAYDASTGAQLWARRYNGPANSRDEAESLAVSPDGTKVVVTGQSYAANGYPDYATVAYDASTGASLWVRRYDGPGDKTDEAHAVEWSPDGTTVFVTGESTGATTDEDYTTIAYDASTGAGRWLRRYNGPANLFDEAMALGVSPDGTTVYATGFSLGSGTDADAATIAYNASTGARLWLRRYNSPANAEDYTQALGVSSDGTRVFVAGQSAAPTTGEDYLTVAYSAL
jgi:PQQ-like domain